MKKPILLLLFVSLIVAALHNAAQAATDPTAKFTGKTVANPNRDTTDDQPGANTLATGRSIAGGDTVGLYDLWIDFQRDNDGDGFYQQFEIFFDIDSRYSNTRIYVTGQLDNGATTPLFRTDPFTVNGATGSDTYSATVLLTDGYPSTDYALTLRVYDAQTNALMLTISPNQYPRLNQLFLEDAERDAVTNAALQLFEFAFTLLGDNDGDGYYTEAEIRLDVDAPQQTRSIYASLYLVDRHDEWIPLKNSSVVTVSGYSTFDVIRLDFALNGGFDPQAYRLGVQLHDAYTHTVLLTSTTPLSTPVRMESADYDSSYYVVEEEYYYEESHHSGGSIGAGLLMMLGLLWWRKRSANPSA
ncbi:MAG: choice-of-anchor H family protein [Gammaproteobacteria bacterium]